MPKDVFIQAIHDRRRVRLTFFCKEDGCNLTRVCAPMDYGPSRRATQKNDRYHLWDYESDQRNHVLSLDPGQVKAIEVMEETFDPGEFITWTTNWFVARDWGRYS